MINSLEEAIKHCEEVAEENEGMCRVEEAMGLGLQNAEMMKCANEHRQFAEWLRELKGYREARQELEDRHAVGTLDLIDSYIEGGKR